MCDRRAGWDYSSWNTHFYHQYLQQHAEMTQWIQNLHQNLPQPWQNSLHHQNYVSHHNHDQNNTSYHNNQQNYACIHNNHQNQHQPVSQQRNYIPQQRHHGRRQRRHQQHRSFRHNSHYDTHHRTRSETNGKYFGDKENDIPEEDNENDGSDYEWVLNAEPFLAFRAANAKSEEEEEKTATLEEEDDSKSEESIELIDTVLDENFEFVQIDDVGRVQKMYGRPNAIDANEDVEYDKEARIVLYGDKADNIAGLETSLEIMFDHINDVHQPIVYPI